MQTKLEQLQTYLSNYAPNGICVAFSGGVDSSLVLKVAAQTVPKVAAVYFQTTLHPVGNQNTAENIAQEIGVPFYVIELDEFTNPNIMKNLFHFKGLGSSAWLLHMHGWNQSG